MNLCVAIPTRNRARSLIRTAESVLPQLKNGDEIIIVDDGSTDETPRLASAWLSQHASHCGRLIAVPHQGASVARNTALEAARCSVVCFIDDDECAGPA